MLGNVDTQSMCLYVGGPVHMAASGPLTVMHAVPVNYPVSLAAVPLPASANQLSYVTAAPTSAPAHADMVMLAASIIHIVWACVMHMFSLTFSMPLQTHTHTSV